VQLCLTIATGAATYLGVSSLLGLDVVRHLLPRRKRSAAA
jgi:hypothetical protein